MESTCQSPSQRIPLFPSENFLCFGHPSQPNHDQTGLLSPSRLFCVPHDRGNMCRFVCCCRDRDEASSVALTRTFGPAITLRVMPARSLRDLPFFLCRFSFFHSCSSITCAHPYVLLFILCSPVRVLHFRVLAPRIIRSSLEVLTPSGRSAPSSFGSS